MRVYHAVVLVITGLGKMFGMHLPNVSDTITIIIVDS